MKLHTRDGGTQHRPARGARRTLDPRRFVRIHRSAIVNIDVVAELRQDAHADYVAVLGDRTEIRVGDASRAAAGPARPAAVSATASPSRRCS